MPSWNVKEKFIFKVIYKSRDRIWAAHIQYVDPWLFGLSCFLVFWTASRAVSYKHFILLLVYFQIVLFKPSESKDKILLF